MASRLTGVSYEVMLQRAWAEGGFGRDRQSAGEDRPPLAPREAEQPLSLFGRRVEKREPAAVACLVLFGIILLFTVGINAATVGATGLSVNLQTIPPGAISPPHIHAGFEATLYILSGTIVHRRGARLDQESSASQGDMIYVRPGLPHQSLNASAEEPVQLIVARTTADGASGNIPYDVPD